MRIFLDIETCPTRDPETIERIRAGIKAPGNFKKPESIAAWMETEGEAAAIEAVAKTALDATHGELIAIGLALDNDEAPLVLVRDPANPDGERELLSKFFQTVQGWIQADAVADAEGRPVWAGTPYFVGHNTAFDLGFLWRRCVIVGIRPPFALPGPSARPGKDFGDTMTAWAGYNGRISLQTLCKALGLPDPKAEGSGAFAHEWWEAGDLEKVSRYCSGDVSVTRDVWSHICPMFEGA